MARTVFCLPGRSFLEHQSDLAHEHGPVALRIIRKRAEIAEDPVAQRGGARHQAVNTAESTRPTLPLVTARRSVYKCARADCHAHRSAFVPQFAAARADRAKLFQERGRAAAISTVVWRVHGGAQGRAR